MRRLPSRFELALALLSGGLLASLLYAVLELATVLLQGEAPPADHRQILVLLGSCNALLAIPALLLGGLSGLLVLAFPADRSPVTVVGLFVRWLLGYSPPVGGVATGGGAPAGGEARVGGPLVGIARVLGVTAAVAVSLLFLLVGVRQLITDQTTAPQAATLLALGLFLFLPLPWLIHQAFFGFFHRILPRLFGRVARPGAPELVILLLLLGGVTGVILAIWRFWDVILAINLRVSTAAVTWAALWFWCMKLVLRSPDRTRHVASRVLLVQGLVLGTLVHQPLFQLNEHAEAKVALYRDTVLSAELARIYKKFFDRDRDGYATILGEQDCDDANPGIHPGAPDVPGNGLDEDCRDGDAPLKVVRRPPPPTTQTVAVRPHLRPSPCPSGRWNVVLISIDTVRWDHTSLSGYRRITTPNLDQLAAAGTLFTRHWAQAPMTKASIPSLLTGRFPTEVFRSPDLWLRFYPENVTFPEMLREQGYRTAGVLSHDFFHPSFGLAQGFEHWDLGLMRHVGYLSLATAAEITDRGISYLDSSSHDARPWFLWLHYIDPHHPYIPHRNLDVDWGFSEIDMYDREIRYTDQEIGRFLRWLEASPHGPCTAIIAHADHGEGFGDHGYFYHGQSLYEDQIRVPLVIRVPGEQQRPRIIRQTTGNVDLAPTILAIARVEPRVELSGMSLLPLVLGEPELPERMMLAEILADERHSPLKALIKWPWKLEYAVAMQYYRLYHLERDPLEQKDLLRQEAAVANQLIQELRTYLAEELDEVPPGLRGKPKPAPPITYSEAELAAPDGEDPAAPRE